MTVEVPYHCGPKVAIKCILLVWFLSTKEGCAWFEAYLDQLPGHPDTLSAISAARWAFFENTRQSSGEPIPTDHPVLLAAEKYANDVNFVSFALQSDMSDSKYYGKTMFTFLGDLVKATDWWKQNEKSLRKLAADVKKVKQVMAA